MVSCRVTNSTLDNLTGTEKPWRVDSEHYGISGTSQAAAVVSGVCALLLDEMNKRGRLVTHYQIANALKKSARPLGYGQHEEGKGLIDVDEALRRI
jgi:subtilase family protein